ncbi:MAG TPA: FlgD immunoglobulin-like domain containing protein, partial [bacterium]|nr:FlgD immunoglobulin-like domain containing protein [bacterium]
QPEATGAFVVGSAAETGLLYVDPLRLAVGYRTAEALPVALRIYDVRGARVRTLLDENMGPGTHRAVWDGRSEEGALSPAGVYLFRLSVGEQVHTGKLVRMP